MPNSREVVTFGEVVDLTGTKSLDTENGLEFGSGQSMVVPLPPWFNVDEGVLITRCYGVGGETVVDLGVTQFLAPPTRWKTFSYHWSTAAEAPTKLEFFPNAPDNTVQRWVWGVWGWAVNGDIQDLETMEEFNLIMVSEDW